MMELKEPLLAALEWLAGPATVYDNLPVGKRGRKFPYANWNGAIRGEYTAWDRTWDSFCPIWHTGQAVKAFVMAANALQQDRWLGHARYCADFILAQQLLDGPDTGLLLAYEDYSHMVNTSAVLEAVDGLFMLTQATGKQAYQQAAIQALTWVANHAWQEKLGKFYDLYDTNTRQFAFGVLASQNRPLLDDAVFLKAGNLTGNQRFKDIAYSTADTLLRDEKPSGNWISYIPCDPSRGNLHPRHAYWWGLPMLDLYEDSHESKYLDCFKRAALWYKQALRRDGGFFRDTFVDFTTPSFGHATSGSACAAIVLLNYFQLTHDAEILPYVRQALSFCLKMQLLNVHDPNLKGAILEKVCFPNGSDALPFHLRDLGTIFFIQAAAMAWEQKTQETVSGG